MNPAMYTVLSGAKVQMRRLDVITHNLANLNTVGFKSDRMAFSEIVKGNIEDRDRAGGMVEVSEQRMDFSQGALQQTGNPLDLAISGEGFFVIDTPRGERYTRSGDFTLSANGTIITPLGDNLLDASRRSIRVKGMDVMVASDGTVISGGKKISKIWVVRFEDVQQLTREGKNLFRGPDQDAEKATDFQVIQKTLERSNVNAIESMVSLIIVQRQYEANQRSLQNMDAAIKKMVNQ